MYYAAALAARGHQTARNRLISSGVVSQPKLTRIADLASAASTPMASRTWDGAILPEEHAEPALTATPARSSRITCVSLETPGRAMHDVLPRRGTFFPKIRACGASLAIVAS